MLTIEIPKSNRRKSEEDALASFSLSEIKEKGECVYFHYGVGWGNNWPHCFYSVPKICKKHYLSFPLFILTFIKEECKTLQVTSEILSCNSLSYQQFGIDINKGIITHITKY